MAALLPFNQSPSLFALSVFLSTAFAQLLPALSSASLACNDLSSKFPRNVAYQPWDLTHIAPANVNFTDTVTHYWNAANGQLVPACVFYPTTGSDVAYAVTVLNKHPDVTWAVKSGGHNPNKGWSSVSGGVLISFRPFMQGTSYNSADQTADVQPGSRWTEATTALEPFGRAVVGGRLGDVGVGGYTLGGGLSFLSSQYGFACDLVDEFEAVLADGTLAKVNKARNTDLFYALKGGGNQFAIVTSFKMRTVAIGQVWGGIKFYGAEHATALLDAAHEFALNYPDPKAAIIVTFESLLLGLTDVFVVFYFYDGTTVPSGVFDKFDSIPPFIDQTKVQSYASVLGANNLVNLYGFGYSIRGQTIPLLDGDAGRDVFHYQYRSLRDYAAQTQPQNVDVLIYSFAIQPMPAVIQRASLDSGANNTFDFNLSYGDRIWMEYDVSWANPLDESNALRYQDHFTEDIVQYIRTKYAAAISTRQTDPNADQFGPTFLNDAMSDQATTELFKPDVYSRLRQIQQARDPKGFFSKRTGGAKFT